MTASSRRLFRTALIALIATAVVVQPVAAAQPAIRSGTAGVSTGGTSPSGPTTGAVAPSNVTIQQVHGFTTGKQQNTTKQVGFISNANLTFDNGTQYQVRLVNEDSGEGVTLAANGSVTVPAGDPIGVLVYEGDGMVDPEPRLWPSSQSIDVPVDVVNGSVPAAAGLTNFSVTLLNASTGTAIASTEAAPSVVGYEGVLQQNSTSGIVRVTAPRDLVPRNANATFVLREENETGAIVSRETFPVTYDAGADEYVVEIDARTRDPGADEYVVEIDARTRDPGNYSVKFDWSLNGTRILQVGSFGGARDKLVLTDGTSDGTSVRLDPADSEATLGDTTAYDVVVEDVDSGVGGHTTTISLANASVGNISDVQLHENPTLSAVNVSSDNSSVTIDAALMDTNDTGPVTIATANVTARQLGTTAVNLSVDALGNETGGDYAVTTTPGASFAVVTQSTDVSLVPANRSINASETATFDVVVEDVSGGVGSHNVTVDLANGSTANVTNVEIADSPATSSIDVAPDNSSVTIAASGLDTNDTGAVTIASVTVEGTAVGGSTSVDLTVSELVDEDGYNYVLNRTTDATLTVTSVPIIADSGDRPTDPDGDGKYEDVDGDGDVDMADVQSMFAHRDDAALVDHPQFFDFSGNGEVDVVDVVALSNE